MSQQQSMPYPVVVHKLVKDEKTGRKTAKEMMPDYSPKMVAATSSTQARELVLAELIKADIYDPADPMVQITVCSPFVVAPTDYR